jgi:lysophospholipid acyltransferase (LPLAT)-like uncharacterized protein
MANDLQAAYKFDRLDKYGFRDRLVIRSIGLLAYLVLRIIGPTIRFELANLESEEKVISAGRQPIYSFWHDRMVISAYFFRHRRIIVLSSQSFDSEYTARFIQRFGIGIIKGSSTRGGVSGLVNMIRAMRAGATTAFTVDGPKGPRYEAKSGPVLLAKKTGNPMLPFTIEIKRSWQIKSWDRLQIPMPFTKAKVIFASPIYVSAESADDELESKRVELQTALDRLVAEGEAWRGTV